MVNSAQVTQSMNFKINTGVTGVHSNIQNNININMMNTQQAQNLNMNVSMSSQNASLPKPKRRGTLIPEQSKSLFDKQKERWAFKTPTMAAMNNQ